MHTFIEMAEYIYNNSKYMKTTNPQIDMFYVSLGKWPETDATLDAVISARDELNNILSEKMGCATKVGLIDKNNMVFDMVI